MQKISWKSTKTIDMNGIIVYNYAKVIERNGGLHERGYIFKASGDHE